MIGIYKITNLLNNKVYIGQSINIERRFIAHKTRAFNLTDSSYEYPLYRAFRKYGLENFAFEILEECSQSKLNERELYWIKQYNSVGNNGYNQTLIEYNQPPQKINNDILNSIILDLKENILSIKDIAKKYNLHSNMITNINQGHSWFNEKISYPIRKTKQKQQNFCEICGIEISNKAKKCVKCSHELQKKVIRPSRKELKDLIRNKSFVEIGKMYNVSDNSIRKWCVTENLPKTKKEIKSYSNEEWNLL